MHISNSSGVPQGTIVLFINQKISYHHFDKKTPLNPKLAHALTYKKDRAEAFVLLAEFAAKTYHPSPEMIAPLHQEWEHWFGPRKLAPMMRTQDNVRGTIIFPTSEGTFIYNLTGNELFIPELEKSFWRKQNPAEALAFLARFAVCTYNAREIFETDLRLGWSDNFRSPSAE